ncbi:hypothetical protein AEGHOMDF_1176 [Methylobacterium soli]|nr:hypothetical protein AEGHOMDF_1176 [Methylobacterium soli]
MISSPAPSAVSRSGCAPGRQWNAVSGTVREPCGPAISTMADRAASGTQKSEGLVAMQCSLQPCTAWMRVAAPMAAQPAPGARLLQGLAGS